MIPMSSDSVSVVSKAKEKTPKLSTTVYTATSRANRSLRTADGLLRTAGDPPGASLSVAERTLFEVLYISLAKFKNYTLYIFSVEYFKNILGIKVDTIDINFVVFL